jgi:uncharacterized delta-60 repeat protein
MLAAPAGAAPGDLDTTFGSGGLVRETLPSFTYPTTVVPAAGGKVYVAGLSNERPFVMRLDAGGAPDPTFGVAGLVSLPDFLQTRVALAVQSDGAVIVANGSGASVRVTRLRPDGSRDPSYHGDFSPPGSEGSDVAVTGIALTGDDRVTIGYNQGGSSLVSRLLNTGSRDFSYGNGQGWILTGLNPGGEHLVVSGDVTYVAGFTPGTPQRAAIVRLGADGKPDTAWGSAGRYTHFSSADVDATWFTAIALYNGKPVAVGTLVQGSNSDVMVVRLKADGSGGDTTFGTGGGQALWNSGSTRVNDGADSVSVQNDGKVVIGVQGETVSVLRFGSGGILDPGFGTGGVAATSVYSGGAGAALMPDGKIVTSGDAYNADIPVLRLTPSGQPDVSFDADGMTSVGVGAVASLRTAASVPDGKTVAAGDLIRPHGPYGVGVLHSDCVVVRRMPDGSADGAFGTGGMAIFDDFACRSIAVASDGSLLLAGGKDDDIAVLRIKPDGSADGGYGTGGYARVDIAGTDIGLALVLADDGKVVVGGGSGNTDFVAVRLNDDGSPDPGFGNGGAAVIDLGGYDFAFDVAVGPGGSVLLAGSSRPFGASTSDFVVLRLKSDGTRDAGFGSNGTATVKFGAGGYEEAFTVAALGDGSVVAGGYSVDKAAIAKLTAAGVPDTAFASAGELLLDFGGSISVARDLLVDVDDKIVVLGQSGAVDIGTTTLVRLTPAGVLDESFGGDGKVTVMEGLNHSMGGFAAASDGKLVLAGSQDGLGLLLARVLGDTSTTAASGQRLTGRKLRLKDGARPGRRAVTMVSRDPTLALGAGAGSADDPTLHGGSLRIVALGGDGFDDTYDLPTGRWRYLGKPSRGRGYRLRRTGPIRSILVKSGKLLRLRGTGPQLGHSLGAAPEAVSVVLTIGTQRYCLTFAGGTFRAGRRYVAQDAAAPAACP